MPIVLENVCEGSVGDGGAVVLVGVVGVVVGGVIDILLGKLFTEEEGVVVDTLFIVLGD